MNKLEINKIAKEYSNGVKALNNVSLTIKNGMFGLLGPNGAGKSSLMRTIATLQEPSQGSLLFNGTDILQNPEFLRLRLGYLPQEFGVYPRMSAFDLLNHFAILKGVINKKARVEQVNALLEQTNLYQFRKKAVSTFSGGMRQRFGIAQALLGDPQLIIVDEPTAGLDPEERNRFHNLLSEIGENVIIILSTHIVEDVRDLCPNMAILGGGNVIAQGKPHSLIDEIKGKVWYRKVNKREVNNYKNSFQILSTRFHSGEVLIHILSDDKPESGFLPVNPDLDDVYFSMLHNLS